MLVDCQRFKANARPGRPSRPAATMCSVAAPAVPLARPSRLKASGAPTSGSWFFGMAALLLGLFLVSLAAGGLCSWLTSAREPAPSQPKVVFARARGPVVAQQQQARAPATKAKAGTKTPPQEDPGAPAAGAWSQAGRIVTEERTVQVRPGARAVVDFTQPVNTPTAVEPRQ
jgi:hypothetical protein